mgnify:CR=1 FL=1
MDWKQEFATKAKMHADVVVGLGVIKFGYSGEKRGWWLPGGVHTTSYIEAEAAARAINRIMMGAP